MFHKMECVLIIAWTAKDKDVQVATRVSFSSQNLISVWFHVPATASSAPRMVSASSAMQSTSSREVVATPHAGSHSTIATSAPVILFARNAIAASISTDKQTQKLLSVRAPRKIATGMRTRWRPREDASTKSRCSAITASESRRRGRHRRFNSSTYMAGHQMTTTNAESARYTTLSRKMAMGASLAPLNSLGAQAAGNLEIGAISARMGTIWKGMVAKSVTTPIANNARSTVTARSAKVGTSWH